MAAERKQEMFGFILAAGCLFGLVAINRRRRFARFGMYRVFQRLETTPGQEQVIRSALLRVKEIGERVVRESRDARPQLAELFLSSELDEEQVQNWFSARQHALDELKPTVTAALKEVHGVLDPSQRKTLKQLIESTPHGCSRHHQHRWRSSCC